jgi:hypothetical protein
MDVVAVIFIAGELEHHVILESIPEHYTPKRRLRQEE